MSYHPHHLHAVTAAWDLQAARCRLVATLAARRAVPSGRDGLRSSVLGRRGSLGGHGDPVSTVVMIGDVGDRDELADAITSATATVDWLVRVVDPVGAGPDACARLATAIPGLRPTTAGRVWRWLAEAVERLDAALPPTGTLTAWPGDCPGCGARLLRLHDAGPREWWTVTCGAGCRCVGDGCPCGMSPPAATVPHIWLRDRIVTQRVSDLGAP